MSDDFDDEDGQHRLVIDDRLDSDSLSQQLGRNADLLSAESSGAGVKMPMKDNNGKQPTKGVEPMDTSELKSPDEDIGNGHSSDSILKHNASNKLSLTTNECGKFTLSAKRHQNTGHSSDADSDFVNKNAAKNFLSPASKKKKTLEKSTCVYTKACQVDESLNLLSLKNGSTACINITIVCKAGGNTLFIVAKWKGKEYHGVLSDGGHPNEQHAINAHKKNASAEKNSDHSNAESTSQPAGGKVRGKRGGRVGGADKKGRNAECNESDECTENSPTAATAGKTGSATDELYGTKLAEVSDKSYIACPHRQCGYRFVSVSDVNTHVLFSHVNSKVTMTECAATQTPAVNYVSVGTNNCSLDLPALSEDVGESKPTLCSRCMQATGGRFETNAASTKPSSHMPRDVIIIEEQNKSMDDLFKVVRPTVNAVGGGESGANVVERKGDGGAAKDGSTPGAFSDISDDGAPTLEKEESFDKLSDTNASQMTKKTPLDEPINILTPAVGGPTLDILSPVLSSSSSAATTAAGLLSQTSGSAGGQKTPIGGSGSKIVGNGRELPSTLQTSSTLGVSKPNISVTPVTSTTSSASPSVVKSTSDNGQSAANPEGLPSSSLQQQSQSTAAATANAIASSTSASALPPAAASPISSLVAGASLTPVQQQMVQQFMAQAAAAGFPTPGASGSAPGAAVPNAQHQQQMAAAMMGVPPAPGPAGITPLIYATPFQPNFQLNPSYFAMGGGLSPAVSQHFAAGGKPSMAMPGFPSSSLGFGGGAQQGTSMAANGLSPATSSAAASSFGGNYGQQKQGTIEQLNAQRHKIYELKSGPSQTSSPGAASSMLMASPAARGAADSAGGGRLSAAGINHTGGPDAPSPLRPSSAVPTSSSSQRGGFKHQPTNSPSSSMTAGSGGGQFLGAPSASIAPNLTNSAIVNMSAHQQAALMFGQQQQAQQQFNPFRQLGVPMSSFVSPEQIAQYAAIFNSAAGPQLVGGPTQLSSQSQQQQSQHQQFPHHPSQKQ